MYSDLTIKCKGEVSLYAPFPRILQLLAKMASRYFRILM